MKTNMDGQDNGTNNPNDSGDNNSATSGGIFSTPELTVDPEKIAQPTPSDERKRVASIFANTTTGQEAQKLNNAMEAQTAPITEDLVIQNEPRKRSKLPLILAGLALLAVIGVVVGVIIINNNGGNNPSVPTTPQTALEAFEDYRNLLINGPQTENTGNDNAGSPSKWYLFDLDNKDLTTSERKGYLSELSSKYQAFYILAKAGEPTNAEELSTYNECLLTYLDAIQLDTLNQKLLNEYTANGEDAASDYIETFTAGINSNQPANTVQVVDKSIAEYLRAQLALLRVYSQQGCIIDGAIDYNCANDISGSTALYEARQDQNSANMIIEYNLPNLETMLQSSTNSIATTLGVGNE